VITRAEKEAVKCACLDESTANMSKKAIKRIERAKLKEQKRIEKEKRER